MPAKPKLQIIHGPNLNLLGIREPDIYGNKSLSDINSEITEKAAHHGFIVEFFQSNCEGEIIDKIHSINNDKNAGLIINAAAYTHTSIAIADALKALNIPIIEVHLSNVYKREEFRHKSYIAGIAKGVICGFGYRSYLLAVEALAE